jgi:hypothetical protein
VGQRVAQAHHHARHAGADERRDCCLIAVAVPRLKVEVGSCPSCCAARVRHRQHLGGCAALRALRCARQARPLGAEQQAPRVGVGRGDACVCGVWRAGNRCEEEAGAGKRLECAAVVTPDWRSAAQRTYEASRQLRRLRQPLQVRLCNVGARRGVANAISTNQSERGDQPAGGGDRLALTPNSQLTGHAGLAGAA